MKDVKWIELKSYIKTKEIYADERKERESFKNILMKMEELETPSEEEWWAKNKKVEDYPTWIEID